MPNKLNPLDLIKFISKSKEMNINDIVKFLLNAIERIVHSQLDPDAKLSLSIDEEQNRLILINESKIVISNEEEYEKESNLIDIKLSEALLIDPTLKVGDVVASEIKFDDFSRTTFSKIEQSFKLEILNLEKSKIYNKFFPLIGEQVDAKLEEDNGKTATFILEDGTHCLMPTKFRNMNISLSDSDYHKVFIEEVYENSRDYQVLVSNSSSSRIREVLKIEVPEIENGTIQIVAISRIPGVRAKISFRKNPDLVDQNIDIIGSIIGQGGQRINSVSSKIGGEKIDVILYSDDFNEYVSNAMSPSKVISINEKQNGKDYLIIVPDKHNTIAIGKQGINVKLTVELTKANIDIISHSDAKERNIDILWNGNVNPEQVAQIEASDGQRSFHSERKNPRWNNNSNEGNRYNSPNLNMDEFDKELADYKTEINEFASGEFSFGDFNPSFSDYENNSNKKTNMNFSSIKDSIQDTNSKKPAQKDLKDIEKSFQFDSDLASDIDFNDYDFSDFDEDF